MSQSPFQKFIGQKKNSVVKEAFRQEKKKVKKERAAYFDQLKEAKRQAAITAKPAKPQAEPAAPEAKVAAESARNEAAAVAMRTATIRIGTFIIMKVLGFTLNTFSLLALSLAIGIVVVVAMPDGPTIYGDALHLASQLHAFGPPGSIVLAGAGYAVFLVTAYDRAGTYYPPDGDVLQVF